MLVSIHQPHYLPWLPYLAKILASDLFIVLDDVMFTRNGWQNRNRIYAAQGPQLLSVPVKQKLGQLLHATEVLEDGWRRKHLASLQQAYSKAPQWATLGPELTRFYADPWPDLATPLCAMLEWHLEKLGCSIPMVRSSELGVSTQSTQRLVDLVRKVGGSAYLSGSFALEAYLDPEVFAREEMPLWLFDWECPEYSQGPRPTFVPNLATLDALLWEGGAACRSLLQKGAKTRLNAPCPR